MGEGAPASQQDNVTSEDMLTDVKLLKKYDGIREKPFGKILTPVQMDKWNQYRTVRYERAEKAAERAAAMEAAAASGQMPDQSAFPAGNYPNPAGN